MISNFSYAEPLIEQVPHLSALVIFARAISFDVDVSSLIENHLKIARARLKDFESEGAYPEIQQWRSVYRTMKIDPTKYRMAAESILRRLRKSGEFPDLHPLVSLCNAISARFALPVAALDCHHIDGRMVVQQSRGGENYMAFDGSTIQLDAGEVTFVDEAGRAHARKWSHKQSALSAITSQTKEVIVVSEAVHPGSEEDLLQLQKILVDDLQSLWPDSNPSAVILKNDSLIHGATHNWAEKHN
jgi:DNA/RNA-binding domain of Phe-tRNA-synthetase-like protein